MRLNQRMERAPYRINKRLIVEMIIDCISDDILSKNEKKVIVQLPKTSLGKHNAVVFVDYLTKWPEVFATSKQLAYIIAKILVEKIVSRYCVHNSYCLITMGRYCQNCCIARIPQSQYYRIPSTN